LRANPGYEVLGVWRSDATHLSIDQGTQHVGQRRGGGGGEGGLRPMTVTPWGSKKEKSHAGKTKKTLGMGGRDESVVG